MADRVRIEAVALSTVVLGQGVPFIQAGTELMRSKSLDRNSYNSGDWFNRLDFTYQSNNFGVGLPMAGSNQGDWSVMKPLLANPDLKPGSADIMRTAELYRELLRIRYSSRLFRLGTADDIQARVKFYNTGPAQLPGLIVMSLSDQVEPDLDPDRELIVVLINANDQAQIITIPELAGQDLLLHPVQMVSVDNVVTTSSFDKSSGTFNVPGRTTAVFVVELPAQEHLSRVIRQVQGLIGYRLNMGRANALIVKLQQAIALLDQGQPKAALNVLKAFQSQVRAYMWSGILTPAQAQSLLDAVDAVIYQIQLRYGLL
jgi:pullulanase